MYPDYKDHTMCQMFTYNRLKTMENLKSGQGHSQEVFVCERFQL